MEVAWEKWTYRHSFTMGPFWPTMMTGIVCLHNQGFCWPIGSACTIPILQALVVLLLISGVNPIVCWLTRWTLQEKTMHRDLCSGVRVGRLLYPPTSWMPLRTDGRRRSFWIYIAMQIHIVAKGTTMRLWVPTTRRLTTSTRWGRVGFLSHLTPSHGIKE